MTFFIDKNKVKQDVKVEPEVYAEATARKMTVQSVINSKYAADYSPEHGTPFQQIAASIGLCIPGANDFGVRAGTLEDILEGRMAAASPSNQGQVAAPFGQAARVLAPVAILDMVEQQMVRNYGTDTPVFESMIAKTFTLNTDVFIQPVVNYKGTGGPEQARAQRVAEFAEPPNILQIGVAEVQRALPSWNMGVEYSDKAQKALTIDVVAMSIARYTAIEKDLRVYQYISDVFLGNSDLVIGAVPVVKANALDNTITTPGVITHRAWVKFLARNRRYRTITHVMGDIDAYMAVESRTGRPGTNNYDPSLARIDPQAVAINAYGFGNDVKWFIVDSAVEGGPIPANEIWGIDATKAITLVKNASADYKASQEFALRRSTAMRWDWGEAVIRQFGDADLRPFDRLSLTI